MITTIGLKNLGPDLPKIPQQILNAEGLQHPWKTEVSWNKAYQQWTCNIEPGFINGLDPRVVAAEDWETDKPQYSFAGKLVGGTEVGLTSDPIIPLAKFRDIQDPIWGSDARGEPTISYDKIPPFFKNDKIPIPGSTGVTVNLERERITVAESTDRYSRNLYTCEIWVTIARPTYKLDVTFGDALFSTTPSVIYNTTYDMTTLRVFGGRPRLETGLLFPDPKTTTLEDRLAGAFGDDGVDRIKIAKVYLLTPLMTVGEQTVQYDDVYNDGSAKCVPFVKHYTFWNLSYMSKNIMPKTVPNLGIDPFLAYFVGRYTFAPLAANAALAAEETRLLNALWNENDTAGIFFTS